MKNFVEEVFKRVDQKLLEMMERYAFLGLSLKWVEQKLKMVAAKACAFMV